MHMQMQHMLLSVPTTSEKVRAEHLSTHVFAFTHFQPTESQVNGVQRKSLQRSGLPFTNVRNHRREVKECSKEHMQIWFNLSRYPSLLAEHSAHSQEDCGAATPMRHLVCRGSRGLLSVETSWRCWAVRGSSCERPCWASRRKRQTGRPARQQAHQ